MGGVWKGGFVFSRTKHHQKQLVQKLTELPPFHGLKIAKKSEVQTGTPTCMLRMGVGDNGKCDKKNGKEGGDTGASA